ncbi:MAG: universal stress protein, partial [Gammaproteobacteria bacterium]|nr:universal stress protein [Gammaproteobacteria bacterium]
ALHVYEAVYSGESAKDPVALQRVELARHTAWVESMVGPIREAGTQVDVQVEWSADWRDSLAPAAKNADADLILKAASVHSGAGRRLLKTSDWMLLRQAHCPVYLIKKDAIDAGAKVLVAMDIARQDDMHASLNDKVLDYGKLLVGAIPEASLHAVNAYGGSDSFVYQTDVAEKAGVERVNAHAVEGAPEKVIPEVAEQTGASIVVIGTAARDGIKAAVIGNTAEKVLDALHTNILTVRP